MLKSLFFILVAFSASAFASDRESCVIQVLKNDTNGVKANFVLACGPETLGVHDIKPFNSRSEAEVSALKAELMSVVKEQVQTAGEVKCTEFDSELFWIGLCHKI